MSEPNVNDPTPAEPGADPTPSEPTIDPAATNPPAEPGVDPAATNDPPAEPGADPNNTDPAANDDPGTAPETYADFVMPDGIQVDEALLTEASPVFKELNLTQEQAQKLVDFQSKQVQAGQQNQVEAFNKQVGDWLEESKNDSEFGGDSFDENVKIAQIAVNKFGSPELKQLLEDYGVGNHPEMIRFMYKVGKLTGEDVPGAGAAVSQAKDRVTTMYPNEKNS